MASWMIHFRIAEALLDAKALGDAPDTDMLAAFVMGHIAPDSGVPSPDGRGYIPNKDTSHFMRSFDHGVRDRCDTCGYADEWLIPALQAGDTVAAAFHLGYLSHLVTDNAWIRAVVLPAKETYAHLRLEDGVETPEAVARFYAFLKKDWYDRDFLYLKHHPDFPVYRVFLDTPYFGNRFLPFFPEEAFEARRGEIAEFYRRGVESVTERETYLSEAELDGFVGDVADEILGAFGHLFSTFRWELTSYSQTESRLMI